MHSPASALKQVRVVIEEIIGAGAKKADVLATSRAATRAVKRAETMVNIAVDKAS
jgi:hypothetical protein